MKYVAIENFTDLQDNNHKYVVGDEFPRSGLEVSKARLEELLTNKNRRQRPVIKAVEEPEQEPAQEPESENPKEAVPKPEEDASDAKEAENTSEPKKGKKNAKKG